MDSNSKPALIVFSGLPATGKTTLACKLAKQLKAVYLRIDSIEQSILKHNRELSDMGPRGYLIGYRLARDNLALGMNVVADSVNPIAWSRNGWHKASQAANAVQVGIEVYCSDVDEHRRRVTHRQADISGMKLPDWPAVQAREYERWESADVVLDTAGHSPEDSYRQLWPAVQQALLLRPG